MLLKLERSIKQIIQNHTEFSSFDIFKQTNAGQSYYSELVPEMKWQDCYYIFWKLKIVFNIINKKKGMQSYLYLKYER